jgi:uncharacterized DUF497 family protein
VDFEWDDTKARSNLLKHGIDFFEAIDAVLDPNRIEEIDTTSDFGEERLRVIGMAQNRVFVVIVAMRDDDTCRIISARKARRHEQDRYYAGDRETW